jgi:hypothetical protein
MLCVRSQQPHVFRQIECLVRCLKSRDELRRKQAELNLELIFTFSNIKSLVDMGIDLDCPFCPGYPKNCTPYAGPRFIPNPKPNTSRFGTIATS